MVETNDFGNGLAVNIRTDEGFTTEQDSLIQLFNDTPDLQCDDVDEALETPVFVIDIDEINSEAQTVATEITERLSNYYFDEKYIEKHPYVPNKIKQEVDNIRRLLKMLSVNEKAQDALITNITANAGKGALYASLTSLQNSMLNIQTQLNKLTESLENIFKEMQDECEKTFEEKEKETEDGSQVVRGSRDFIRRITQQRQAQDKVKQASLFNSESED